MSIETDPYLLSKRGLALFSGKHLKAPARHGKFTVWSRRIGGGRVSVMDRLGSARRIKWTLPEGSGYFSVYCWDDDKMVHRWDRRPTAAQLVEATLRGII